MSQDDLSVANGSGAAVRADINSQLQALGTLMSGASGPSTTYAYMWWADTTNGRLKQRNAANTAWVVVGDLDTYRLGSACIQRVEATPYTSYSSVTTTIPVDDTIPQNTEGDQLVTVSITPIATTNRLVIRGQIFCAPSASAVATVALFQDSTASALAVSAMNLGSTGEKSVIDIYHEMAAGTTSSTTFKLRAGPSSGTLYINGDGARKYGGIAACRLSVEEYQ